MATVFARGNKLWIQYYIDGRQKKESLNLEDTRENRKIARKLKKQKEVELDNGIYRVKKTRIRNKGILLSEGFGEFLFTKENKAKKTKVTYETAFNTFKEFVGDRVIGQITEKDIKEYELYLTKKVVTHTNKKKNNKPVKEVRYISPNTIANYFNHLKIVFKFFEKNGYIKSNPVPGMAVQDKPVKIIPEELLSEILIRLRKKDNVYYKTIMLYLLTGLRANELTRLTFEDIDFKNNLIKVKNSKGKREDILPLYPELKEFILKNWKDRKGKLIPFKSRDSLKFWNRFLAANEFPNYSIHTLRKTFLSNLVNSGLSVYDVKTMARHKDIKTTMKFYLAADMNKLGEKVNSAISMNTKLLNKDSDHLHLVESKNEK